MKWQRAPHLDAIRFGSGDFVWYQPVSEAEALRYMDTFREAVRSRGNE